MRIGQFRINAEVAKVIVGCLVVALVFLYIDISADPVRRARAEQTRLEAQAAAARQDALLEQERRQLRAETDARIAEAVRVEKARADARVSAALSVAGGVVALSAALSVAALGVATGAAVWSVRRSVALPAFRVAGQHVVFAGGVLDRSTNAFVPVREGAQAPQLVRAQVAALVAAQRQEAWARAIEAGVLIPGTAAERRALTVTAETDV